MSWKHRVRIAAAASSVLLGALVAGPVAAQTRSEPTTTSPSSATEGTAAQPRAASDPVAISAGGPLLDRPVVRSQYQLGPGDVVDVSVFGSVELLNTVAVTPEGTVVIPGVGVARVLGLNLDQAEARVRTLVNRLYRDIDVTLTLSRVRTFKVFVVAEVPGPGVRSATAVTRVSEVIPNEVLTAERGFRRNIVLRHPTGDSVLVDLARFTLLGDMSANPTLREGDAVLVRAVDQRVAVFGAVTSPGRFEYRAGETLAELISLVTGGRGLPVGTADTIRVSRFDAAGRREFIAMTAAEAAGARGQAFVLRPFDAVYIASVANFGVQRVATVTGQVRNPGTYPIRPDTTTVRELVEMAGGFTSEASLVSATLRRTRVGGERVRTGDDLDPDSIRTSREQQVASITRRSEQEAQDYVVIDFQRLFSAGDDAYNQTLVAGDELSVPSRRNDIAVLGAVGRPGLVGYRPGLTLEQYVGLAGGFSRRSAWRETTVLKASSGARLLGREVARLEPGDRIVVPFRERRGFLERIQTTQAVIGIVSGAALTVASLLSLF